MIQTWIADVTPLLNEEIYYVYYRKAPHFRKKKADRLKQQEGRALSIGAVSYTHLDVYKRQGLDTLVVHAVNDDY